MLVQVAAALAAAPAAAQRAAGSAAQAQMVAPPPTPGRTQRTYQMPPTQVTAVEERLSAAIARLRRARRDSARRGAGKVSPMGLLLKEIRAANGGHILAPAAAARW